MEAKADGGGLGEAVEGGEGELDALQGQETSTSGICCENPGSGKKTGRLQEACKQLHEVQEPLGYLEGPGIRLDRRLEGSDLCQTTGKERTGLLQGGERVEEEAFTPVSDDGK